MSKTEWSQEYFEVAAGHFFFNVFCQVLKGGIGWELNINGFECHVIGFYFEEFEFEGV